MQTLKALFKKTPAFNKYMKQARQMIAVARADKAAGYPLAAKAAVEAAMSYRAAAHASVKVAEEPVAELLDIDAHFAACQGKVTPLPRLEHLRAELEVHRDALEALSENIQILQELKVSEDSYDMHHQRAKYGRARDAYLAWEKVNMEELAKLEENHYWGARHYEAGGALLHGCPHPEGSDAAKAWASGWTAAQEIKWAPIYAAARKI